MSITSILAGRARLVLGLAVAAIVALPVAAFPQSASAAQSDCPLNAVCIWKDANYTGQRVDYYSTPPGYCWGMIAGMNDAVSSIYNHTNHTVKFYENAGCTLPPHHSSYNLGAGLAASSMGVWNDIVSSFAGA